MKPADRAPSARFADILRLIGRIVGVLPSDARRFLWWYSSLLGSLALLDLAALSLLALSLPSMIAGEPLSFPLLGTFTGAGAYVGVILVVAFAILLKSTLNVVIIRRGARRFARHEVAMGDALLAAFLKTPWEQRLSLNTADIVRSVDAGVSATVYGVLIPFSLLAGEVLTTVSVFAVLVIAQPLTAAISFVYLGAVALVLTRIISRRAVYHGRRNREYAFRAVRLINESVALMKEITLRNALGDIRVAVDAERRVASDSRAALSVFSVLPRFILEAALIVGFLVVGGAGWLTGGQDGAVAAIALFAIAGFRIIPSLTRFQAVLNQIHANSPFGELVVDEITRARTRESSVDEPDVVDIDSLAGHDLELSDVTYRYPGAEESALDDVSLTIPQGSRVAIVGSSGAGKSTLLDVVLGLLDPSSGTVKVGGVELTKVLRAWRAGIGFVPQEVILFNASIARNVALRWNDADIDHERVAEAIEKAQLVEMVNSRSNGLDSTIGERGMSLSGGQKQRLGIARALYAQPRLLILDEATSALDTATEHAITSVINDLPSDVTVITVAHRLATIRSADTVFYFASGRLEASGTFDEVVSAVPDFAYQSQLAGLTRPDGDTAKLDDTAERDERP